jgi:hypothetical protein
VVFGSSYRDSIGSFFMISPVAAAFFMQIVAVSVKKSIAILASDVMIVGKEFL